MIGTIGTIPKGLVRKPEELENGAHADPIKITTLV